jgi:hypothetical protein
MAPEGRQSPEPESQTNDQVAPPASVDGVQSDKRDIKRENVEFLKQAESNPEHILAEHAELKTSKELGNITMKSDGSWVQ